MAEVTAALVKALREKSGAGMMDCRNALQETGGDVEAAIDYLRAKGHAKAAKKADRIAAEGVIAVAARDDGPGMTGAVVELNAETDFVARNERFKDTARAIANSALDVSSEIDGLHAAPLDGAASVAESVTDLMATIGENLVLRRFARFHVEKGVVAAYAHSGSGDATLGRIGVIVAVEGEGDRDALKTLAHNVALHVAFSAPLSLSVDDLDPAAVDRERAIFTEQALESGKPPAVAEKMVEGRIRKFYEEAVLLKQAYVRSPDLTIEQLVAETAKAVGSAVTIVGFRRLALGEGIEKEAGDFAAEVAAMTGAR